MICRNHLDVAEGVRRCTRCGGTYCTDCLVTIQHQPFCATCKNEQLLDVRSGVDRTGPLAYGRFWPRFGASLLDGVIIGIPAAIIFGVILFSVASMAQAQQNDAMTLLVLVAYIPLYAAPVIYEALMLSMKKGQTVGKMALKLRVVRPDGSNISTGQAWGRALIRLALNISCLGIFDYITFFFTQEKTTLHDMVAGTRVVESYQ